MGFARRLWHTLFRSSPSAQPRLAAASLPDSVSRRAAGAASARPRPPRRPAPGGTSGRLSSVALAAGRRRVGGAASAANGPSRQAKPPRYPYRSREEIELALLMPWLTDAERARFLARLAQNAGRYLPWSKPTLQGEPWEQCQKWEPLALKSPETMTVEGFCCWLETELTGGLQTFRTPLEMLSRPVRMLWLWRQGRRAGQVYAALEQALGSRPQALEYAWSVVAGL